ncbi:MAG: alpha-galactosidase [Ruminococcus sp.]|nr:alpha-galactosidase [Ruminococcus sp.]
MNNFDKQEGRKTPLMGWASWNCFRTDISEERIKEQAKALVDTGLAGYGYTYFNLDDGFFGGRGEDGKIQYHKERFPNGIRPISDYAHSLGLKAGIYAEGGDKTCGFYYDNEGANGENVGLYGHEEQDLNQLLVEENFDFIKVDWCGGLRLGLDEETQYTKIGNIIEKIRQKENRDIVYNICRWQFPGVWATTIADSWRTGADICPVFSSVMHQLDVIKPLARYCRPGHVNDLDMMQIGNGLTYEEEKTHFAMWCMMSTPLMIGCDLTKIKPETLEILKNRELIALNQDPACKQAYVIREIYDETGQLQAEIWLKELEAENEKAVAFLNRGEQSIAFDFKWVEAGMTGEILAVRDLAEHTDCEISDSMKIEVGPHAVRVFRVKSENSYTIDNKDDAGEFVWKTLISIDIETAEKYIVEKNALLVDVRTEEEYESGHLDGAVNVPYTDVHGIAKELLPDKERTIIVYCATGKRSSQAKMSLEYLGYKNIYHLKR